MITLTFTKANPETLYYWETVESGGAFQRLLRDAAMEFKSKVDISTAPNEVTYSINTTIDNFNAFLNAHQNTIYNILDYCNANNITVNTPIWMHLNNSF